MKSKKPPKPTDFDPLFPLDKRTKRGSRAAKWVAHWLLNKRLRGVPNIDVINQGGEFLELINGDGDFLRQVADELDALVKAKAGVGSHGGLSLTIKLTPKVYIGWCWTRWEAQRPKAKIEERLALIRERCGKNITKSRYYGIVEQLGLKST